MSVVRRALFRPSRDSDPRDDLEEYAEMIGETRVVVSDGMNRDVLVTTSVPTDPNGTGEGSVEIKVWVMEGRGHPRDFIRVQYSCPEGCDDSLARAVTGVPSGAPDRTTERIGPSNSRVVSRVWSYGVRDDPSLWDDVKAVVSQAKDARLAWGSESDGSTVTSRT